MHITVLGKFPYKQLKIKVVLKIFQFSSEFYIFAQNIDCGYLAKSTVSKESK